MCCNYDGMCQIRFNELESCFHVCSQENHPVLFRRAEEFKIAMNIVAFVAFLFPDLKIYTFEIMNNHFHFLFSGKKERVDDFVKSLVSKLSSIPEFSESADNIKSLIFNSFSINNIDNFRNVISYINRNGSLIASDQSVYTYRWGANRYFFNDEAKLRFLSSGIKPSSREKRALFHSDMLSRESKIVVLDGYVSPLCFCHIDQAELLFRNNRHYFYHVSRNIEASREIAETIGESLFYSDEDLFAYIKEVSSTKYGSKSVSLLSKGAKIDLARDLHFNYNAGNKQISRLLKIDLQVVSSLFPERN